MVRWLATGDEPAAPLRRLVRFRVESRSLWVVTTVVAASMLISSNGTALAIDWSSCHSDLDRLRRASRDAADAADQAGTKYRELESADSDAESKASDLRSAVSRLRSCQSGNRDCTSEQWRYESARSDDESAKSRFESAKSDYASAKRTADREIDTVAARLRASESSCNSTISGTVATI